MQCSTRCSQHLFLTDEDLIRYVPDSAGDLGSETEASTKLITTLQYSASAEVMV